MKKTEAIIVAVVLFVAIALMSPAFADTESQPAYLDPSRPLDERVSDLVSRMTLEEKASQLVNRTRAIPRLGVPEYNLWSEALHGVANNGIATVFPQAIGLAATFNPALIRDMAGATGREGRAKYNIALRENAGGTLFGGVTFFSPNINIFRDPRWGRGQETYGEDPFLAGKMAVAFITGLQGDDSRHLQAVATAKHYAVHSGPEPLRHGFNAVVSLHDMEDTYLPAFREAVVEGDVRAVMCVYNAVNGVPGCASDFLLGDMLRDQWKFEGFVTGDCDAVHDIHANHKYVKTAAEGAAAAIKAGTDNDCVVVFGPPEGAPEYQKYIDAARQGLLDEARIDRAVSRMMRTRFELGLFDPPETVKPAQVPDSIVDSEPHRALALKIARESMVLLKNNGLLPLSASTAKIAVVGPLADSTRVLLGNYNGTPSRATTALDGIRKQFPSARVTFEPGTTYLRPPVPVPAAVLSTDDGQPGLKAEIFKGRELDGDPVETRIDSQVMYGVMPGEWPRPSRSNAPAPLQAARWTGRLTPTTSGIHTLAVEGFGNRLYLDGKLLVDTSGGFPVPRNSAEVQLEAGRGYALKVEAAPRWFASTRLAWLPAMPDATERAVAAAREADVVVAVVGITAELEGEESALDMPGFKGGDRTSLDLPKEQEELLKAVKAAGKPLVVALMSGSPLAVNWANEHADAILQAWYPGEEGGQAIAETLVGVNNPAGRLPITFHTGVEQLPEFTDYSMANRTY
ncbi:MAG: glycoside hydrolase family 3 C-terminal domain-containing protein, partial [Vicinamibacteria bacterium]|nr:glycoside hydrolase family 3 C-terminal domain-containing protein [Vicinamibacteria bacterium]